MFYGDGFSLPEFLRPNGSKPAKLERGGVRGGLNKGMSESVQTTPDPSYSGGEIPIVISTN